MDRQWAAGNDVLLPLQLDGFYEGTPLRTEPCVAEVRADLKVLVDGRTQLSLQIKALERQLLVTELTRI